MDAATGNDNNNAKRMRLIRGHDCLHATPAGCPTGQPPPPKCGPLPRERPDAKGPHGPQNQKGKKGAKIYAQRKASWKPVNGQIKGRPDGLRRFLLKGH